MPSLSAATTPGSRSTADAMIPEQPANHRPGNRLIPYLVFLTYRSRSRFLPRDFTTRVFTCFYLKTPNRPFDWALVVDRTALSEKGSIPGFLGAPVNFC